MYSEAIDSAWQELVRPVEVIEGRDDLTIIAEKVRLLNLVLLVLN